MAKNREFGNRRLHSLLGVIPIGLFLIFHLSVNFMATKGEETFNGAVHLIEFTPVKILVEWVVIYLPILFHAVYGIYIAFTAKNNLGRFGFFRNWMFMLQRVTGIITLIFLVWHIWQTRVQAALGATVDFDMMAEIFSSPFMLVFYIVGIISAIFHFANGLWSFAVSWGLTVSPRSQRIMTYFTLIVFVLLSYIGISAIFAFV
ncbi:succinate dehydrogenase cytochrome b558 subunit [Peribacillus simplex]|uniref:Succinate dehydrogenase n=2 Tax=Peribacillus simplex TaxID=1478 RepID=A0A223EL68_9BACI|nr:succinate dehydrogenase cytochrome b558 subunit [Peribacillus simplex]ASS95966.1 succinate dehydrogenase [Peribacillus simplex NBRC 15720 = DSM 1321]MEC1396414.1 succinate dehydrogenase cytochrome b558 subunit [Peribacillus simplex]MED3907969.1 succinate dehydrogenase cytochrome b558 subunit [Peribacillus simplex]MED3985874.1 succinate dehydrogenase cytochrome b558 subunit [Peribacillus simplex]MED4093373.1 succinate dehydrogenase cytochrome b558 subunit [Peribacillus simplex]